MPQQKGLVSDDDAARIRQAIELERLAHAEVVNAVLDAMRHGGSIREVAVVADLSERTIIRWRKGQGLPTVAERREATEERLQESLAALGLDRCTRCSSSSTRSALRTSRSRRA